jgi:hypothetical protein
MVCGEVLPRPSSVGGRRRVYCSNRCRQRPNADVINTLCSALDSLPRFCLVVPRFLTIPKSGKLWDHSESSYVIPIREEPGWMNDMLPTSCGLSGWRAWLDLRLVDGNCQLSIVPDTGSDPALYQSDTGVASIQFRFPIAPCFGGIC